MNRNDRALLLGLMVGDGYIQKIIDKRWVSNPVTYCLRISHSAKQLEYAEHKASILHKIMGGCKPNVILFDNNGHPGCRFQKTNKLFRIFHSRLYKNGKKVFERKMLDMLSPESIALWYMDDGNLSMKKRNGKIHARELFINTHIEKEENQIIIDYFSDVHDVKFSQVKNKRSYRLRCGTKEAIKFIAIVSPFIIPSMQYKIDMQYN